MKETGIRMEERRHVYGTHKSRSSDGSMNLELEICRFPSHQRVQVTRTMEEAATDQQGGSDQTPEKC